MPKERSPNRDKAFEIYKEHNGDIDLVEIAKTLGISDGTVRGWKNKDHWNDKLNGTFQKKSNKNTERSNKSVPNNIEVSWVDIENEYVTDKRKKPCTLESLGKKFNISIGTIEKYSMEHNWSNKRKKYKETVKQKTVAKICERDVDRNLRYLDISDMALDAVEEYLKNKHYKKHIIKYKIYVDGKPDSEELVAVPLDVADTKALANVVSSLEKIQKGQRLAEGLDKENNAIDIVKESNNRITVLADLINNPAPDRQIQDFEEDE